jgi:conjugal transfer ATP-binding protein TraC
MKPSTKTNTLADYCPIESIDDDGFILDKDGSQGFIFECVGIDGALFESSDWESVHEKWRNFLKLNPKEELQIVFRKTSDFEVFFEKKLDELTKIHGASSQRVFWKQISEYFESIGQDYVFETSLLVCFRKFLNSKASLNPQKKNGLPVTNAEDLKIRRETMIHQCEAMGLKVKILKKVEIFKTLAKATNGRCYISDPELLEEWPSLSISPQELTINSERFRALTLKSLPEAYSQMGMMQALTSLPLPIELSVRFRGKDLSPIKKRFERKRQILFGLATRKATGDPASEAKFKETDSLLRRLNEQNDSLSEMTFTLGIRGKNDLFLRRALTSILNVQSVLGQVELEETSLSTFDSYLETIPWFYGQVFHEHSILSSNGIHFLPFFNPSHGDNKAVVTFRTKQASLYNIDPISERLPNYNWLVSGTSGAGKSFFVNSLLLQSLSLVPRVFIVDIGGSYNKLTEFLGGKIVSLEAEKSRQVGPFFMQKSPNEKEERRRREHIELIFQEMCRDEGKLPSVEERALLHDGLVSLFESDSLPEHPILALQQKLSTSESSKAKRLSLILRRFSYGSAFGDFLDHSHPLELNDSMVTFDLKGLKEFEDLLRVVELILCSAIWQSLRARDRFTYIVLDEVAFSLLKTQPQFVDELVSTVRKHFAGVVICVQGLEKITSNSAGAAILANTNFKAILQQRGDARGYEEPLGLKAIEAKAIRSLDRKKGSYSDVFLMDDDRRSILRYEPNALEYLLSTSDPRENQIITEKLSAIEGSYPEKIFKLMEAETV